MPPVGFEPTISAGERPQTYALDRAATGTGLYTRRWNNYFCQVLNGEISAGNEVEIEDTVFIPMGCLENENFH